MAGSMQHVNLAKVDNKVYGPSKVDVVIANGASLSGAATLDSLTLIGIITPAAWTAGDLTFQASYDGTLYNNLHLNSDTELTYEAGVDRYIKTVITDFRGIKYLKVRSGTSGTPVNQAAARTVSLVLTTVL